MVCGACAEKGSSEFSCWNAEKLYGTERDGTVHCEANRATFTVVIMGCACPILL